MIRTIVHNKQIILLLTTDFTHTHDQDTRHRDQYWLHSTIFFPSLRASLSFMLRLRMCEAILQVYRESCKCHGISRQFF